MAVKKKVKKKTGTTARISRSKNKRPFVLNEFKKILMGIGTLVFVCLCFAMGADLFFAPGLSKKNDPVVQNPVGKIQKGEDKVVDSKKKSEAPITYEVFEDVDQTVIKPPLIPKKDTTPKIAIIIDDIGYDKTISMALCDLNPDITFSILPFSPFGKIMGKTLYEKGAQLMLHLPMEPVEYPEVNPGPGAILSHMPPDDLIDQLKKNIQAVPNIVGVNNHMGSRLTTHSDQMNQIFTILKKENLFFIDSRTSAKSQCLSSARLFRVKFARRDVFLDNIQNPDYIAGQLKKLIALAKKNGTAIGIGHPYEATLKALSRELPKLKKNKIKLVRANALVAVPG